MLSAVITFQLLINNYLVYISAYCFQSVIVVTFGQAQSDLATCSVLRDFYSDSYHLRKVVFILKHPALLFTTKEIHFDCFILIQIGSHV